MNVEIYSRTCFENEDQNPDKKRSLKRELERAIRSQLEAVVRDKCKAIASSLNEMGHELEEDYPGEIGICYFRDERGNGLSISVWMLTAQVSWDDPSKPEPISCPEPNCNGWVKNVAESPSTQLWRCDSCATDWLSESDVERAREHERQ